MSVDHAESHGMDRDVNHSATHAVSIVVAGNKGEVGGRVCVLFVIHS